MVRAIREGRKTQTRRIGKFQNDDATELGVKYSLHATNGMTAVATYRAYPNGGSARHGICGCPYGIHGDRLWVKETWRADDYVPEGTIYQADIPEEILAEGKGVITWKPSIHMSRKRSRLNLEITGVRVERLQEISEHDAYCEGVQLTDEFTGCMEDLNGSYVTAYEYLWKQINGEKSWEENPWVWVIEFSQL